MKHLRKFNESNNFYDTDVEITEENFFKMLSRRQMHQDDLKHPEIQKMVDNGLIEIIQPEEAWQTLNYKLTKKGKKHPLYIKYNLYLDKDKPKELFKCPICKRKCDELSSMGTGDQETVKMCSDCLTDTWYEFQ